MKHMFDIEIAKKYGITCAVIMENMFFWTERNRANDTNFFDGRYWTYNSKKALTELFPYLTQRQIEYSINKLEEEGILIKGNFNKSSMDRTLWYAFTDLGLSIFENSEIDFTKLRNGTTQIVKPIPYINTDNYTDINTDNKENTYVSSFHSDTICAKEKQANRRFVKPTVEEVRAYISEKNYPIDAEQFWNFYEAKGWMIGKAPMKNWRACVATWLKNGRSNSSVEPFVSKLNNPKMDVYDTETTWDDLITK